MEKGHGLAAEWANAIPAREKLPKKERTLIVPAGEEDSGTGTEADREGGDRETGRQGDKETRRQGDKETRRKGEKEKGRRQIAWGTSGTSPSICLLVPMPFFLYAKYYSNR